MDLPIQQEEFKESQAARSLFRSYRLLPPITTAQYYSYNGMREVDGKRGCRTPQDHGLDQTGFLGFAHDDGDRLVAGWTLG